MDNEVSPRFEVIADFPGNKDFPIGSIIEFKRWGKCYWQLEITDCQGTRSWLSEYFDKFPHIFKKL